MSEIRVNRITNRSGLGTITVSDAGLQFTGNTGVGTDTADYTMVVGNVGAGGTQLWVNGDARVTGILSVGQGTITLDPNNNMIKLGGTTMHQDSGTGDTILMKDGAYNPFRASRYLIDDVTVINKDRGINAGVGTFTSANITGNLNVGGTLTYEDVTNIDSVGVITARSGVNIGTGSSISSPGSNILTFGTGNAERVRITSDGKVGIGTIAPSEQLHLLNSSESVIRVHTTGASSPATLELRSPSNGRVDFRALTGDAAGRILYSHVDDSMRFSTKTPGGSRVEKLHITSTGRIQQFGNNEDISMDASASGQLMLDGNGYSFGIAMGDNHTALYHNSSSRDLVFGTNETERLRITSAGNVGISENNPQALLHLNNGANSAIMLGNTTHGYKLRANVTSSNDYGFLIEDEDGVDLYRVTSSTGTTDPNTHRFYTGGAERLKIDSTGRILQGISSAKLGFFNDGNAAPVHQIQGSTYYTTAFSIFRDGAGQSGPNFILAKGREAIVQDDDILGTISFQGHDGTTELVEGVQIQARVDGTPGSNDMPGRLIFNTTSDGASLPTERMRIQHDGKVSIGGMQAYTAFEVKGHSTNWGSAVYGMTLSGDRDISTGYAGSGILLGGEYKTGDSETTTFAYISGVKENTTTNNTAGSIRFGTRPNGGTPTEALRINSAGNVNIGGGQDNGRLTIQGTSAYSGAALYLYEYTKQSTGGIRVIGGETSVEIIGEDSGTHGADVMLRYANDGFIMNANPTDDTLDINAFTASANGFTSHATGGNQSYWKQIAKFHRTGGISFNGDTAAVNRLDDYEEGTFTPAITAGYSGISNAGGWTPKGYYVKVGNLCHVSITFYVSTTGYSSSTRIRISNLPFIGNSNSSNFAGTLNFGFGNIAVTNYNNLAWYIPDNQHYCELYSMHGGAGYNSYASANLSSDWIQISGTYTVD